MADPCRIPLLAAPLQSFNSLFLSVSLTIPKPIGNVAMDSRRDNPEYGNIQ